MRWRGFGGRRVTKCLHTVAELRTIETDGGPAQLGAWRLLGVFMALGFAAFLVPTVNRLLDSPLATHAVVAVLAIVWFTLPAYAMRLANASVSMPAVAARVSALRWSGALTLLVLVAWSTAVIHHAMAEAESAAMGQPYCVEVAGNTGPHPVRSYFDLSGFYMHANASSLRHASLVTGNSVDPRLLYWSYYSGRFVPENMGDVLQCKLESQYVRQLTWRSRDTTPPTTTEFGLGGGQWRIPLAYLGRGSYRPPELHFYASGSRFDPPTGRLVEQGPQAWEQIRQSISVSLCKPATLHGWHRTTDVNHEVKTVGSVLGLEKQSIRNRVKGSVEEQYVQRGIDGQTTTWMTCGVGEFWQYCEHAFVREGVVIRFTHPQTELAQWRRMENALWARVKSFSVVWPVAPPASCGGGYG